MSHGIRSCVNCIGLHPDEFVDKREVALRMMNPAAVVAQKLKSYESKKHLYKNKVCILCGRAYDQHGNLDESWHLTGRFVKLEFDHAGVLGVDESMIRETVIECHKAYLKLRELSKQFQVMVRSGKKIHPDDLEVFETLSFAGRLALIITNALESRRTKNALSLKGAL